MPTLTAALRRTARLHGNNIAVTDRRVSYTWTEFLNRVARAASVLQDLGVAQGDHFGILALNSFRHAELLYAGCWLGAVPVPVNFRLAPPEIAIILEDAGCRLIAADPTFMPLLDKPELARWRKGCLVIGDDNEVSANEHEYEGLMRAAPPAVPFDSGEHYEALLLYTGGTSGRPKGVPLSHRNILANAMQIALTWPPREQDVVLHVAPMFHSAELVMLPFTLKGATHAYLPKFTPQALFQAIQDYGVTVVLLVPTMLMMAVDSGLAERYDIQSLERIIYGASPMSMAGIMRTTKCLPGVEIVQGYGLTETSPLLSILDYRSHMGAIQSGNEDRLRSCGRPLVGVDLRIVGDDGKELPPGDTGEIVVRGPNVFSGYLNLPELTTAAFRDGWFHTGDAGMVDDEGYVYILDRKKDMIITGGENVYSGEVEAVLHQHPRVAEAAVIGLPDERYGESVFAVVVPTERAGVTEQAIIEHCRGKIGDYKIPKGVAFVEAMPKSALGKILKTVLREQFRRQ